MSNRFTSFDDVNAFARNPRARPNQAVPKDIVGVPLAAKLATSTVTLALPGNATQTTPADNLYVEFLSTEAQATYPRIINVYSLPSGTSSAYEGGGAFDCRVEWTSGGGRGGATVITGSGGGLQFFLHCKTLRVSLANWLNVSQTCVVSVEDGDYGQTQELRRTRREQALAAGAFQEFQIPRYARFVTVASDTPAQRPNILVSQIDDGPTIMSAYAADTESIPVGAASRIRITNNNGAPLANYVLDFKLGYQ